MSINLVKLSVGSETVDDLARWQKQPQARGPDGLPRHITRMWPKRGDELLQGGSLYWVIKGMVLVRQPILRLDAIEGEDGVKRCALVLDPTLQRTQPQPRRPFQGWRYLAPQDAPPDAGSRADEAELPPKLQAALSEIGVI